MDESFVEHVTGFNKEYRETLVAYYLKLPENIRIYLMVQKRISINHLNQYYDENKCGEFYYSAFLKTIDRYRSIEMKPKRKGTLTKDEMNFLDNLSKGKVMWKHKKTKKKDVILKYYSLVLKLRVEGFSWNNISIYLKNNFGVTVSWFYLMKIFKDNTEGMNR